MSLIQSKYAKGQSGIPYPAFAGEVVAKRFWHQLDVAPALNDILELAPIPNLTRPIQIILDADDLDTGTAITFDVGIMSGNWGDNDASRTIGNEFFAASTLLQGGGVATPTKKEAYRVFPALNDRSIGVKFTGTLTGFQAGIIGLTVLYATE